MPGPRGKKYSDLILAEAIKIYREEGMKRAVKLTGVHSDSICFALNKQRIANGCMRGPQGRPPKYTAAQKIGCITMATSLVNKGHFSARRAMMEACRKFKMNFNSIWHQWIMGVIYLPQAQQPATSSKTSGSSNQTANPQAQAWAEQCRALAAMRPAARISKRREYSGPRNPRSQ